MKITPIPPCSHRYFVRIGVDGDLYSAVSELDLRPGTRVLLEISANRTDAPPVQADLASDVNQPKTSAVIAPQSEIRSLFGVVVAQRQLVANDELQFGADSKDLRILRVASIQDRWLEKRLTEHLPAAMDDARDYLNREDSNAILLEADFTLEADWLMLQFLNPDTVTEENLEEIATIFRERLGIEALQIKLEIGCGPNCGDDAASCGTSCGSCGK